MQLRAPCPSHERRNAAEQSAARLRHAERGGAASLPARDRAASPPVSSRYTCSGGTRAECSRLEQNAADTWTEHWTDTCRTQLTQGGESTFAKVGGVRALNACTAAP